jgi:DNA-directed RNA polymerase specialized sigma24 family protein
MPNYTVDELLYRDYEREAYSLCYELQRSRDSQRNIMQEGLVNLFREWLDLISPADFGNDEGLEGILV